MISSEDEESGDENLPKMFKAKSSPVKSNKSLIQGLLPELKKRMEGN
jgi:hypothetical protein